MRVAKKRKPKVDKGAVLNCQKQAKHELALEKFCKRLVTVVQKELKRAKLSDISSLL